MISALTLYHVAEAMVPLYVAMGLGYASIHFRTFTAEQCAGINHFVAAYAMPFLIFHLISSNDPYSMDLRFIAADTLQKLAILAVLAAWALWASRLRRRSRTNGSHPRPDHDDDQGSVAWVLTLFSLATLPNTIIMGVPILSGMYSAAVAESLMVQIVVLQFGFWYTLVLFLFEYKVAKQTAAVDVEQQSDHPRDHNNNYDITVVNIIPEGAASVTNQNSSPQPLPPTPAVEVRVAAAPSVRVVAVIAGKKILKIPSTYASVIGLAWSFVAYRFGFKMPGIIGNSVTIISQTAVGLGMFSVGTFMARRKQLIACSYKLALVGIVMRFLVGPLVMALASLAVGLHGTILHLGIVQAALPLAVVSFVYAEEYHLHPDIMSTGVTVGIFLSVPITILYYVILEL